MARKSDRRASWHNRRARGPGEQACRGAFGSANSGVFMLVSFTSSDHCLIWILRAALLLMRDAPAEGSPPPQGTPRFEPSQGATEDSPRLVPGSFKGTWLSCEARARSVYPVILSTSEQRGHPAQAAKALRAAAIWAGAFVTPWSQTAAARLPVSRTVMREAGPCPPERFRRSTSNAATQAESRQAQAGDQPCGGWFGNVCLQDPSTITWRSE